MRVPLFLAAAALLVAPTPLLADPPSPPPGTRSDRVLVKFKPLGVPSVVLGALGSSHLKTVGGTSWSLASVPANATAAGFVSTLQATSLVADAELDVGLDVAEGNASTLPAGGSLLASQVPDQDELLRIGADEARARATGDGVRVAVIDSGILADHESVDGHLDLDDAYDFVDDDADPADDTNGVDDDGDGLVDEAHAHGTFVASLVLAVAPDAEILPIRVLDADGIGSASDVALAIKHAVDHGADVVNLSLSVPVAAGVVREAIANAEALGVVVVSAAGNSGLEDATWTSEVSVVVAATDPGDVRADFASHGSAVDLCAPGVDLHGAYPEDPGTAIWSGSSFSAALVSGAFALLVEQHPTWSVSTLVDRVLDTSASISGANPNMSGKLGEGRLDLDAATEP